MIELALRLTYGAGGDGLPTLREGWSTPEPEFTWTVGTRSRLCLPLTPRPAHLMLELGLGTTVLPPLLPRKRLHIEVNGIPVATEMIGSDCTLGIDIPAQAIAGADTLDIVLHCPDAFVPPSTGTALETRQLGVCVYDIMLYWSPPRPPVVPRTRPPLPHLPGGLPQAVQFLTALAIPDLAAQFESLGHNCEFGLVQRNMGREPLGLLRFAGIHPRRLVEALDLAFEGIDAPGNLTTFLDDDDPNSEIMVRDTRYGIHIHSYRYIPTTTRQEVLDIFHRNIAFLRRKFLEDLCTGGKIFVYQHWEARSLGHARPILNLLRSHGPNSLLFVMQDDSKPSGTVVQVEEDLFHASIAALAPMGDIFTIDVDAWIHICANTYRLWRESGRGA